MYLDVPLRINLLGEGLCHSLESYILMRMIGV
jgi:hypothetical protein